MKTFVLLLPMLLIITNCYGREIASKLKRNLHQRSSSSEILKINGIHVYNNATKHLLAFVNCTSKTAIVFDYFTTNLAVINGQTKRTILINPDGYQLIENDTQLIWPGGNEDFETFYKNLPSLPSPENSNSSNSNELMNEIGEITNSFDLPNNNPLETLRDISRQLNTNRDVIKVFLSRNRFPLVISHGISRFVRIIGAIGRFWMDVIGGLASIMPTLMGAVNHMDFSDIINASNGFEAFIRLLHQFAGHLNFAKTLNRIVNDGRHLFNTIQNFGGDDDNNVDNFFKLINNLLNLRNGNIQIDDFIRNVLNLRGNLPFNIDDIRSNLEALQNIYNMQNSRFNNGEQLQNFYQIIQGLNGGNLNVDGVDISRIMHLLGEGDFTNAVQLLIKIIIRMNELFNPFIVIPRVIIHFVSRGLHNANIDLPTILQNGNFLDLLQHNNEMNNMYQTVLNSVQQYSNGSLNLNNILSPNHLLSINNFSNQINGLLSIVGNSGSNENQPTTTPDNLEGSARSQLQHHQKRNHQQRLIKHERIHKITKQ